MKFIHLIVAIFFLSVGCTNSATENTSEKTRSETPVAEKAISEKKVILFFGNSLSAGYGVEADESFPALIEKRIDSLGLPYIVVNAGVTGETTATGLSRLDWVL